MDTDLSWTQIYVGHRSKLDTDLCWTQIYVKHRSMLATDLSWPQIYVGHRSMLDNRSKVVNWTTFWTIFGLFPGGHRSVPRTFFINRKALPRGSGGVLSDFFRLFRKVFRKVPRSFSSTPGWFLRIFGKIGFGALGPLGPPLGPPGPNEDSYTNSRSTARQAAASNE